MIRHDFRRSRFPTTPALINRYKKFAGQLQVLPKKSLFLACPPSRTAEPHAWQVFRRFRAAPMFLRSLAVRSRAGWRAQIRCQVDTLESGLNLSLEHVLNYLDLVLALPRMAGRSVIRQFLRLGMSLRGVEIPFHPHPMVALCLPWAMMYNALGVKTPLVPATIVGKSP